MARRTRTIISGLRSYQTIRENSKWGGAWWNPNGHPPPPFLLKNIWKVNIFHIQPRLIHIYEKRYRNSFHTHTQAEKGEDEKNSY